MQTVDLPEVDQGASFQLFHRSAAGDHGPTPVPFRVSQLPNILEQFDSVERNGGADIHLAGETPAELPVAFNGILEQPGDVDVFWFMATPEVPLQIEVFSDRIGASCDTLIRVVDAHEEIVAFNDDWGSHDSRLEFYPPEAGSYGLVVTDKLAAGGPTAVYRIEVTPLTSGLVAFLPRPNRMSQQSQTVAVPRGNRALVRMGVRRDRVDCDVTLSLSDLPNGVHASPMLVPHDQFWVPVVMEASDEAEQQGTLADAMVTGGLGDLQLTGHFEQVIDLVAESADRLFTAAHVDRLPVAVTTPVPFKIELVEPTIGLPRGGSLAVRVNVLRDAGFDEPVRIELPFLPPWVVSEPFMVIPAGQDHAWYHLEARPEAVIRDWPFVAVARVDTLTASGDTASLNGREVATQLVTLSVQDAPMSGTMQLIAAEQGTTIDVLCSVERIGEVPATTRVELEGLPNRITAEAIQVHSDAKRATFKLVLADDAPLGEFQSIQCRFSGELDGQPVSYVVARNIRLVVTPRGKLYRSDTGELLSPLEALKAGSKQ